jgi:serine/threonine protein kinase
MSESESDATLVESRDSSLLTIAQGEPHDPGADPFGTICVEVGCGESITLAEAPASGIAWGLGGTEERLPRIPGYEVIEILGRGGMGVVYKARNSRLNRLCALKMILGDDYASPEDRLRLLAEAETVAKLCHPNIVQIYGRSEHDNHPFLELEYLGGGSLAARLDGTPRPPIEAARLIETLARAVAQAHRLGVVHRDLKPANVLLTEDDVPKVSDFGLAKSLHEDSGLTATGAIVGTPSYMAPEQAEGRVREVGYPADIYALGTMLYELIVGRPPFRGATIHQTMEQVRIAEPVPPSRLVPGVPRDLETIILRALQKEPQRRYESAQALADDLARFVEGEPILARPVPATERAWRWCKRKPWLAGLSATIVLLLIATTIESVVVAADMARNASAQRELANKESAARLAADRARADSEQRRVEADSLRRRADALRKSAEDEATKARQTAHLLTSLFNSVDPLGLTSPVPLISGNPEGANKTARELLNDGVARVRVELKDQPELRADLLYTLGGVYTGLCKLARAEDSLSEALEIRRSLLPQDDPRIADTLESLGILYICVGDGVRIPILREALRIREKSGDADAIADAQYLLGIALGFWPGSAAEAEELIAKSMETQRRLTGDRSLQIGMSLLLTAYFRMEAGNHVRAVLDFQQAASILKEHGRLDTIQPFQALVAGGAASAIGQRNIAVKSYTQALNDARALLGQDHLLCGYIGFLIGEEYIRAKQPPEAEAVLQEAHRVYISSLGADNPLTTNPQIELGRCYLEQGRFPEAEQTLAQATDVIRRSKREINTRRLLALDLLGRVREQMNNPKGAFEAWSEGAEAALVPPQVSLVLSIAFLNRIKSIAGPPELEGSLREFVAKMAPRIRSHPQYANQRSGELDGLEAWAKQ